MEAWNIITTTKQKGIIISIVKDQLANATLKKILEVVEQIPRLLEVIKDKLSKIENNTEEMLKRS